MIKKIIVGRAKRLKTGCNLAESYKETHGSERAVLSVMLVVVVVVMMMMMMMMMVTVMRMNPFSETLYYLH
jgi:hypothetical protein